MIKIKDRKLGITLIETLLYCALFSVFIMAITIFAWDVSTGKIKNDSQAEVDDEAQIVMDEITGIIRNAKSIVTPASTGSSSANLVLSMPDGNVKTFDLASDRLRVTDNNGTQNLTSNLVSVSQLTFTNVSNSGTPGCIRIQMLISRSNLSGGSEYRSDILIDNSITLKPN